MPDACPTCGSVIETEDNFCRKCGRVLRDPKNKRHSALRLDIDGTNARVSAGALIAIIGALLIATGYFFGIIPLLSLGVSAVIVAIIAIFLLEPGKIRSQEATNLCLPSLINLERLLEALYLSERAIYIPAIPGTSAKLFIPLIQSDVTNRPPTELSMREAMFLKLGGRDDERGVLLEVPGSAILHQLEEALDLDATKADLNEIQAALSIGLKFLGLGKKFNLQRQNNKVEISFDLQTLIDLETKMRNLTPRVAAQIGGPIESALLAAVAKATQNYVILEQSAFQPSTRRVTIVMSLRERH